MNDASTQRLAFLDGLRLVAAGAVVMQHLFERVPGSFAKAVIAPAPGVFGVVLFFMISGYVIPFSVRRGLSLRTFAIRRLTRIYPLYLVALALAMVAGAVGIMPNFGYIAMAGTKAWIANVLLVQDFVGTRSFFPVSWTLAIEIIWYTLFALLLKTAGRRAGDVIAIAAPAGMLLLTAASLLLETRIPLGRPGMIYAAVLGFQTYRHSQGEISGKAWRLNVATFLLVTLASNFVAFGLFHHPNITLAQAIGPWTLALLIFVGTFSISWLRGPYLLGNRAIVAAGAISYSIYMMHPFAIAIAVYFNNALLIVAFALSLTLLLASLTYHLVEKPGIGFGRWLVDRTGHRAVRRARAVS